MDPGGSNAVSHVSIRQKLASVAQFEIWNFLKQIQFGLKQTDTFCALHCEQQQPKFFVVLNKLSYGKNFKTISRYFQIAEPQKPNIWGKPEKKVK